MSVLFIIYATTCVNVIILWNYVGPNFWNELWNQYFTNSRYIFSRLGLKGVQIHNLGDDDRHCSTTWINGTRIQFLPFSADNFAVVYFLMPAEFSANNETEYRCLFRRQTRGTISTAVSKLGAPWLLDSHNHTLYLSCKIPVEVSITTRSSATLVLGKSLNKHLA